MMPEGKEGNEKIDLKMSGVIVGQINQNEYWWKDHSLLAWPSVGDLKPYAHMWVKWPGIGKETFLRFLARSSQCTMIPKYVGEVLIESRLVVYENAMVDGTKVKIWMKIGIFGLTLCKVIVALIPRIIGMDIMSDWGTFPLSCIIKQKACICSLLTITWTCWKGTYIIFQAHTGFLFFIINFIGV